MLILKICGYYRVLDVWIRWEDKKSTLYNDICLNGVGIAASQNFDQNVTTRGSSFMSSRLANLRQQQMKEHKALTSFLTINADLEDEEMPATRLAIRKSMSLGNSTIEWEGVRVYRFMLCKNNNCGLEEEVYAEATTAVAECSLFSSYFIFLLYNNEIWNIFLKLVCYSVFVFSGSSGPVGPSKCFVTLPGNKYTSQPITGIPHTNSSR